MRRALLLLICVELALATLSGADRAPGEPILPALYEDPMA